MRQDFHFSAGHCINKKNRNFYYINHETSKPNSNLHSSTIFVVEKMMRHVMLVNDRRRQVMSFCLQKTDQKLKKITAV
jgi:hypothetical protein